MKTRSQRGIALLAIAGMALVVGLARWNEQRGRIYRRGSDERKRQARVAQVRIQAVAIAAGSSPAAARDRCA